MDLSVYFYQKDLLSINLIFKIIFELAFQIPRMHLINKIMYTLLNYQTVLNLSNVS